MDSVFSNRRNEGSPVHLLMRFSDRLHDVGNVIEEHQEVIQRRRAVWMGKLGKPLGLPYMRRIREQVGDGVPTHLWLVQHAPARHGVYRKGQYVFYQAVVEDISRDQPSHSELLLPEYYSKHGIIPLVSTWIKLSSLQQTDGQAARRLVVAKTQNPVLDALRGSIAALFIVKELEDDEWDSEANWEY